MPTLAEMLRQGSWNTDSGDTTSQLVNALRGAAETGATLGTGALAGLAGMPYGIYKGITSGAYGTPEAPRIAAREAQQFMERNTYQPRTEQGQEYVQKLGRLFEESKLPPVMPEAAVLGAIPKQAYAAQAERAGMAAEKALKPAIMRTMERGGKPAQLLEDLAQGTRRQIFIGENAKTWDKVAAENAAKLEKAGVAPEEIWQQSEIFNGPESKLRQEISDKSAHMKGAKTFEDTVMNRMGALGKDKTAEPMTVGDVFYHSKLFEAYPDLQNLEVRFTRKGSTSKGGLAFDGDKKWIELNPNLSSDEAKSTMLHELQHAIQEKEGFAKGGSPEKMILTLEDLAQQKRDEAKRYFDLSSNQDPLNPQIIKPGARQKGLNLEKEARQLDEQALQAYHSEKAKFDLYQRLAGEAESRATQARINMTPEERRAKFPYESYDVPKEQLIIKGAYQ